MGDTSQVNGLMLIFLLFLAAFFFQQTFLKVMNSWEDEMSTLSQPAVCHTPQLHINPKLFSSLFDCLEGLGHLFGIFISLENSLKQFIFFHLFK